MGIIPASPTDTKSPKSPGVLPALPAPQILARHPLTTPTVTSLGPGTSSARLLGPPCCHPLGGDPAGHIPGGVRASRGGSEHPFWLAAVAGRLAPAGLRGRNLPMEIFGSCPAVVSGHFCRQGFLVLFEAAPGAHHVPLRAAAVPRPQKTAPGWGLTGPCRGQAMPERPRSPG